MNRMKFIKNLTASLVFGGIKIFIDNKIMLAEGELEALKVKIKQLGALRDIALNGLELYRLDTDPQQGKRNIEDDVNLN